MQPFQVLKNLRGLCALAFVLHHSHILQSITELALFRRTQYLVELFFALSGFLLYRRCAIAPVSVQPFRQFVITRACRVFPLHVVMLLVFIGFEGFKLISSGSSPSFGGDRAPSEMLPNLLLLQAWWPGANALSFNYPSWFVSVQFYAWLLFGLIAMTLPKYLSKFSAVIAAFALLALYVKGTPLSDNVLRGLGCFFAGGVTYWIYSRLQHLHLSLLTGSVLEVLILAAIYGVMTRSDTSQDALLGVLFCVAVGIFAFEAGGISRSLRTAPLRWLGRRWFSIYMTHAAVIFVASTVIMALAEITGRTLMLDLPSELAGLTTRYISLGSPLLDNLLVFAEVVVVLAVSALTYRCVELPGIALGKRWSKVPTPKIGHTQNL
ncbi:MAG: Peptidoglycan/LPS O-acetylase OafA/YrhL, contains acyltransferase and SGNH-hydrolase domain [Pseudomonas sp.]|nr:Peptidoglycan/LPS O-acetylase OafA/YrhL, contains acyltransferase and SGNH-hydrolase domain [Pseudomonas sp.]